MKSEEWLEIVKWVQDRLPGWSPDRAAAYGVDLGDYQAEDVWDALYRMYDRGLEYAPNGSQVKSEVTEVVRERLRRNQLEARGLTESDKKSWSELFDGSLEDAIKASHERQFPKGCPYALCDVCGYVLPGSVVDSPSHVVT